MGQREVFTVHEFSVLSCDSAGHFYAGRCRVKFDFETDLN